MVFESFIYLYDLPQSHLILSSRYHGILIMFLKIDTIFPNQFNSEVPRTQDGEIAAELAHRWP